jgi:type II secretory pathway pseudopilin PulG
MKKSGFILSEVEGFSLLEILIVIALLVTLVIGLLININPWGQLNKAHDSKRKQELNQLSKTMEDWFNDKGCYPKPIEICYDIGQVGSYNPRNEPICIICGTHSGSPAFPYLSHIPCDPQSPTKYYFYYISPSEVHGCPTWYRIYANLSNVTDPVIEEVGCAGVDGCPNVPASLKFNYGVSSQNVGL